MTTVFHAWPHSIFIKIRSNLRRQKLHRKNQGSNFLGGSFSNRDNVKASIQFGREMHPPASQMIFPQEQTIYFHINSTSVIRPVQQNQLSFSSIEINKPLPVPVHGVLQIRFKFKSPFQLLPQIRCLIAFGVESSITSIDSNITDNITSSGRSLMYGRKVQDQEWTLEELQHLFL